MNRLSACTSACLPGDPREVTLTSADLTGLMGQLDDFLPPEEADPGPGAGRAVLIKATERTWRASIDAAPARRRPTPASPW